MSPRQTHIICKPESSVCRKFSLKLLLKRLAKEGAILVPMTTPLMEVKGEVIIHKNEVA